MIYNPTIIDATEDAKKMVELARRNWDDYFGTYAPFYHIATEAVSTYVPEMGNNFETALTIGASGDQGIALNQRGAKNIYFFDVNRATIYWLMLRKTAFETLKRKDFLDFMIAENNGEIMEHRLYQKVRNLLSVPIRTFWDNLYKEFRYDNHLISIYLFRDTKKHAKNSRIVNDYYANSDIYYATQKKVKESNWFFIESDFYSLDKNLPDDLTIDAIILSNIYEYLNFGQDVSRENAKKYLDFIKTVLLPRLNQGGACMSAYIYRFDEEINESIKSQLVYDPDGWIPSSDVLSGLKNIEKFFTGYTGQNVSYHYLYDEFEKEPNIQKVKTKAAGYGFSSSSNDLAIIQRK